jgi:tRNA(Ile2) C34 agmatinyltransferase TiaS
MSSRTALKEQMMAAAEEIINGLLAEADKKEVLQLSDIERLVRSAGEAMMGQLTTELVEVEAQQAVSDNCPECGQKMRYKGKKSRYVHTETGEVRLTRGYYYCPTCRQGHFPPGSPVGSE